MLARVPRGRGAKWHRARPAAGIEVKRVLKLNALRDCGRRCVYCARALAPECATLDHVIPRALGGHSHADNLAASCRGCNVRKGSESPAVFFLRDPRAGLNFLRLAHAIPRHVKRAARRAVSLGFTDPLAA